MSEVANETWTGLGGVIKTYSERFPNDDLKEFRFPGLVGMWGPDDSTNTGSILTLLPRAPRQSAFRANSTGFSPSVVNRTAANNQLFAVFDGTKQLQSSGSETALTSGPMQIASDAFSLYFMIIPTLPGSGSRVLYNAATAGSPAVLITVTSTGAITTTVGGGTARTSTAGKLQTGVPCVVGVMWNSTDNLIKNSFNGVLDGAGQTAGTVSIGTVTVNNVGGASGANLITADVGIIQQYSGIDHGAVSGTRYANNPADLQASFAIKYGL